MTEFFGIFFSISSIQLFDFIIFQRSIIRKKSTEGLPFPMILTGTLISFLWFLHGVVSRVKFVIYQNGFFFLLSALQLSLFAIYPSKSSKPPAEATKKDSPIKNSNNNKKED